MPTLLCSVEGCSRGGKLSRGYCENHYRRALKHGDPIGGHAGKGRPRTSAEHGATGYDYGCRCEVCRAAKAELQRLYKEAFRAGTADQKTDGQRDALIAAGVKADARHLFEDHGVSGAKAERPGLTRCLDSLRAGDTLVVAKLDRLGRPLGNLVQLFQDLSEQGVSVRILDNPMLSTEGNSSQAKLSLGSMGPLQNMNVIYSANAQTLA